MNRDNLIYEIEEFSFEAQICGNWETVINTNHINDIIDLVLKHNTKLSEEEFMVSEEEAYDSLQDTLQENDSNLESDV